MSVAAKTPDGGIAFVATAGVGLIGALLGWDDGAELDGALDAGAGAELVGALLGWDDGAELGGALDAGAGAELVGALLGWDDGAELGGALDAGAGAELGGALLGCDGGAELGGALDAGAGVGFGGALDTGEVPVMAAPPAAALVVCIQATWASLSGMMQYSRLLARSADKVAASIVDHFDRSHDLRLQTATCFDIVTRFARLNNLLVTPTQSMRPCLFSSPASAPPPLVAR